MGVLTGPGVHGREPPPSSKRVTRRAHGLRERWRARGRAVGALLRDTWIEYQRDRASYFAKAILYFALISLVPMLFLLLSTIGLLLRYSATAAEIERRVLVEIEARFGAQMSATMTGLLQGVQQGSMIATIIGVVGMLLTASLLFRQLRMTFRAVWNYEPPLVAGSVRTRLLTVGREWALAFAITLGGGALLLVAVVIIAAFNMVARLLDRVPLLPGVGGFLAVLSSFVLAAITYGALLRVLPPRTVRWRDILPAVPLCAGTWVVGSEILPLYHRIVGESPTAYNAIGALLPLLVLVNLASKALFFGAELSKVRTWRRERQ